jgi:hypothetical protein
MRLNKSLLYALLFLLCFFNIQAFSAPKKLSSAPILTPINGLSVTSTPGQITITNSSGTDIKASTMLLSFSLNQTSLASAWGTPWLNWQAYTGSFKKSHPLHAPLSYQFTNQADLPNNVLPAGSSISFQYTPIPWNTTEAATGVQLFNMTYPLSPASITSSVAYSGGVNTITINNTSGTTLNLSGAQLQFSYQNQIGSSVWGTPWANWSVATGAPNYVLSVGTPVQIAPNGTLIVSFQGGNAAITNIALMVQNAGTPASGAVTVNVPNAPALSVPNPSITITGPSFPQGQSFAATWGQALPISGLQIGSYALSTPNVQTSTQIYQPTFSSNPVVVSGSTPVSVNLSYNIQALSDLMIQMPVAPDASAAAPTITVQGPSFPTATTFKTTWGSSFQVCPSGASTCPGLSPGNYTVTVPSVYSATDAFTASGFTNPVVLTANQTTTVPVSYAPAPQGTFSVTINTPASVKKSSHKGLQTFAVQFTNSEGYTFAKSLTAGANTVSLPINDTYQIAAPSVSGQVATTTPSSVTVSQSGTPAVTIQYQVGAPTQFVVYYGGWEGDEFDLNTQLPANVTAVNLSFANITSALQVDTAASGWLTNVPAPNVTMQPTYINWTVYKYNHPNSKILLSVGGATFSSIWTSTLTSSTADQIAQNIAKVINQPYPVYSGTISSPSKQLGNVAIDGVDLDVETGGTRLSPTVASNVVLLVNSLKKYLNPGKLITYAGFSVGADPNGSQCTVPSSVHCGEDIPILQGAGNSLAWVTLMAYDAGQTYATSLYQTSLANYAQYVPKTQLFLGLDIQSQWDPVSSFTESAQQLASKANWAVKNGYGGAMFWGVDVDNNPSLESQYVNAISQGLQSLKK